MAWLAYIWLNSCLVVALLSYMYREYSLSLHKVLFIIDLTGIRLARAVSTLGLVALHLAGVLIIFGKGFVYFWHGWPHLVKVLFTFGLAGVHLASVLFMFGLVA